MDGATGTAANMRTYQMDIVNVIELERSISGLRPFLQAVYPDLFRVPREVNLVPTLQEPAVKELCERLIIEETSSIIVFRSGDHYGVWVVTEGELDVELQLKYSDIFFSVVDEFPEFVCDFMVFTRDEFNNFPAPKDIKIVYKRGREYR
ncbi:MAG TPA: hypothetical protein GXX34_12000 [Clostridia bacterium]|nr:hypothetical protein [Clostridia bacterium]